MQFFIYTQHKTSKKTVRSYF